MSSIWNGSVVRCFEYYLVHTKPIQFDMTCTNPPGPFPEVFHLRLTELGPILYRNPEHHHSVSVYWIDLIDIFQLQKLRLHGMLVDRVSHLSPLLEPVVFLSMLFFEHLLSCGSECACREVSSMQTQSSHQAHRSREETGSPCNRSRCHKIVCWLCYLNFFDPVHCDLKNGCSWTNLSPEVDFPALQFHRVWKFSQVQFRNRASRISNHTTVRIISTSLI